VARTTDPNDRRSRVLKLTPRGLRLRMQLRPGIIDAHDRVLSPLSRSERSVFLGLLTRVVESNETYARPGNGRRRPPKRITEQMR
jgi:DNA-binding MarR family transcriptional regulator